VSAVPAAGLVPPLAPRASVRGSVYSGLAARAAASGQLAPLHIGDTWLSPPPGARVQDLDPSVWPEVHRYAPVPGLPALREALAARATERAGVPTLPEQVVVTAGATGGLSTALGAMVREGDDVLILSPAWPLFAGMLPGLGARAIHVPATDGFARGDSAPAWAAAATSALEAARTPRTVAIYVASPSNPAGVVLRRPVLEAIAAFARAHGLWIVSDEVYADLVYADVEVVPLRALAPERTLEASSLSKAFGIAGYRVGYVIAPPELAAAVARLATYSAYCAPTPGQAAGLAALGPAGEAWLEHARAAYAEIGAEAAAQLGLPAPEGATFLWVDVAAGLDDRGVEGFLTDLADEGVLVAPGEVFGPWPHHVRVCFTSAPPEVTRRGVATLARRLRLG
jgi:aspartate/methionine/tyrosine aminotransferase